MVKIGDLLYDMRIVKTYNGQYHEKRLQFNGFEGIIVWITWDTGEWEVLRAWREKGEYKTEEIGYIDDSKVIEIDRSGEDIAKFIKSEVNKICSKNNYAVNEKKVKNELLHAGIIGTKDVPAIHNISKKIFDKVVEWLTEYINKQIDVALQQIKNQYDNFIPIAIDETIASIIQIHDKM